MGDYKPRKSERIAGYLTPAEKKKFKKYLKENNLTESAAVRLAVRKMVGLKPQQ